MGLFDFINRASAPSPPSFPNLCSSFGTKSWKVDLSFGSDPDMLKEKVPMVNLTTGWQAHLVLYTSDIIGLMRKGLYVSQKNVIVEESCLTMRPYRQENNTYYYDRQYALTGPSWKGNLVVTTLSCPVATNFRVEHLSADKVYHCYASDYSRDLCWAYNFMIEKPEVNANYILDDTPLEGLWPWPRKEPLTQDMEKEREQEREKGETEEGDMIDLL
ncbi:actin-binding FH2 [Fusarium sp. NRRL 52700]|nr:actin-binding FH2 [Fusarium sp. NRRL 52700]